MPLGYSRDVFVKEGVDNSVVAISIAEPVEGSDAATKKYVDDAKAGYIDRVLGGTMSGDLSLGVTNKIVNLGAPTLPQHVATKGYVDTFSGALNLDGTNNMAADLDLGSNRVSNLATPIVPQDIATKAYVDSNITAAHLQKDGSTPMVGNLDMGANALITDSISAASSTGGLVIGGVTFRSGDLTIPGNLVVGGSVSSLFTDTLDVGDPFAALAYNYSTPAARAAGLVVVAQPTGVTANVAPPAGFAYGLVESAMTVDDNTGFAVGDFVLVTGASTNVNNGLYQVSSLGLSTVIRVANTFLSPVPFVRLEFQSDSGVGVTGSIHKVAVSVLRASTSGVWQTATASNVASLVYGSAINTSAGDTMAAPISLGTTNRVVNLANPTLAQDIATKVFVDTTWLLPTGGTMSGSISLGGVARVTNLPSAPPSNPQDVATKDYVDSNVEPSPLLTTGGTMSGDITVAKPMVVPTFVYDGPSYNPTGGTLNFTLGNVLTGYTLTEGSETYTIRASSENGGLININYRAFAVFDDQDSWTKPFYAGLQGWIAANSASFTTALPDGIANPGNYINTYTGSTADANAAIDLTVDGSQLAGAWLRVSTSSARVVAGVQFTAYDVTMGPLDIAVVYSTDGGSNWTHVIGSPFTLTWTADNFGTSAPETSSKPTWPAVTTQEFAVIIRSINGHPGGICSVQTMRLFGPATTNAPSSGLSGSDLVTRDWVDLNTLGVSSPYVGRPTAGFTNGNLIRSFSGPRTTVATLNAQSSQTRAAALLRGRLVFGNGDGANFTSPTGAELDAAYDTFGVGDNDTPLTTFEVVLHNEDVAARTLTNNTDFTFTAGANSTQNVAANTFAILQVVRTEAGAYLWRVAGGV